MKKTFCVLLIKCSKLPFLLQNNLLSSVMSNCPPYFSPFNRGTVGLLKEIHFKIKKLMIFPAGANTLFFFFCDWESIFELWSARSLQFNPVTFTFNGEKILCVWIFLQWICLLFIYLSNAYQHYLTIYMCFYGEHIHSFIHSLVCYVSKHSWRDFGTPSVAL